MDEPLLSLILPLIIVGPMMVLVIGLIVYTVKYRLFCRWSFRSHEITAEIRFGRAKLFVDGKLEDEFAGDRIRICTLRSFIEGVEVKVRVTYAGFHPKAEASASANGEPLTMIYCGK